MKFIAHINEGDSFDKAFIGWQWRKTYAYDRHDPTNPTGYVFQVFLCLNIIIFRFGFQLKK